MCRECNIINEKRVKKGYIFLSFRLMTYFYHLQIKKENNFD